MSRFKPQLDKPKDGFGPCRFVALFTCPGVHTFTQFGRKTDGRYGIVPGGATAFLCTRGHMLPFLFTFIIYRPSGDLQSPRRKAAVITGTSRRVCPIGCSCPICRTRLRTPSTAVSQSDFSEWPEAGLRRALGKNFIIVGNAQHRIFGLSFGYLIRATTSFFCSLTPVPRVVKEGPRFHFLAPLQGGVFRPQNNFT